MAYKLIILYRLYIPSYSLVTFTEYPYVNNTVAVWANLCVWALSASVFVRLVD